ncbi:MAG TPA: NADPH:quinone reductase [Pirellulales bacterium]|jgi:NADPH2:quinone reductase|nr:NADPH:quinone reductase [Pirellulales bacterium]
MKAAFIEQLGPPENIKYADFADPIVKGTEVLVKVGAVAVNPIDTYIRSGAIQMPIPLPYILGCDLAGEVVDAGPLAIRYKKGDRVWGSNQGLFQRQGTFSELASIDEGWLYRTPADVTDEQAAAGALVGITAHLGLVRDAAVKATEVLFVNGGSGGVGSTVIQMCKTLGAHVITTAGSDEKCAECRALGADHAINYKTEDVEAEVQKFAPHGLNIYWETLREPDFDRAVRLLAPRGRMIIMAGRDARPQFPVGPFYVKGLTLRGFAMFNATPEEQRSAASEMNLWMSAGKLSPKIGKVFPLSEAAAAHRLQEDNTLRKAGTLSGKIVLKP